MGITSEVPEGAIRAMYGDFLPPRSTDNVWAGMDYIRQWYPRTSRPLTTKDACEKWLECATAMMAGTAVWTDMFGGGWVRPDFVFTVPSKTVQTPSKLPPMHCKKCNFMNEYVGEEHLASDRTYTCRQCKKEPK